MYTFSRVSLIAIKLYISVRTSHQTWTRSGTRPAAAAPTLPVWPWSRAWYDRTELPAPQRTEGSSRGLGHPHDRLGICPGRGGHPAGTCLALPRYPRRGLRPGTGRTSLLACRRPGTRERPSRTAARRAGDCPPGSATRAASAGRRRRRPAPGRGVSAPSESSGAR